MDTQISIHFDSKAGSTEIKLAIDLSKPVQAGMWRLMQSGQFYEPEVTKLLLRALREGDTFVDVGAHIGYFSAFAAKMVGPKGLVVAFDPDPENAAAFRHNMDANRLCQVLFSEVALYAREADLTFWKNLDNDGGHALWNPALHPANDKSRATPQPRQVHCYPLKALMPHVPIRVLKIDTEGAEMWVLEGATPWLETRQVAYVVAEINTQGMQAMGSDERALEGLMRGYGYSPYRMLASGDVVPVGQGQPLNPNSYVVNILFSTEEAVAKLPPME